MAEVVVAQPIATEGIECLERAGHSVLRLERHDEASLISAVTGAHALLVRDARVTRRVLESGHRLRVVSRHGAGLDRIDLAAATELGITVTYTPEANSTSVAEHALAMILALAKNLLIVDPATRANRFGIRHELYGVELSGKALGVLGLGNVGRRLAHRALHGLDMQVIAFDPYADRASIPDRVRLAAAWQDVVRDCDVVSLHLPLSDRTRGMFDRAAFRLMKPTALFINCSRGELVVEADLVEALAQGTIAGAAVDVFRTEPPPPDHPLFSLPNVIVTPHSAAHTAESMRNMALQAAQGVIEVLSGSAPTWPANHFTQS